MPKRSRSRRRSRSRHRRSRSRSYRRSRSRRREASRSHSFTRGPIRHALASSAKTALTPDDVRTALQRFPTIDDPVQKLLLDLQPQHALVILERLGRKLSSRVSNPSGWVYKLVRDFLTEEHSVTREEVVYMLKDLSQLNENAQRIINELPPKAAMDVICQLRTQDNIRNPSAWCFKAAQTAVRKLKEKGLLAEDEEATLQAEQPGTWVRAAPTAMDAASAPPDGVQYIPPKKEASDSASKSQQQPQPPQFGAGLDPDTFLMISQQLGALMGIPSTTVSTALVIQYAEQNGLAMIEEQPPPPPGPPPEHLLPMGSQQPTPAVADQQPKVSLLLRRRRLLEDGELAPTEATAASAGGETKATEDQQEQQKPKGSLLLRRRMMMQQDGEAQTTGVTEQEQKREDGTAAPQPAQEPALEKASMSGQPLTAEQKLLQEQQLLEKMQQQLANLRQQSEQ